jgi:hypothetical protein
MIKTYGCRYKPKAMRCFRLVKRHKSKIVENIVDLSVLASDVLLMAGAAGVAGALFSLVDTVSMPPAL